MFFRVISNGLQNRPFIAQNVKSLDAQTISTWHHYVNIDVSNRHIPMLAGQKRTRTECKFKRGMMANIVNTLNYFNFDDEDVICLVDLDDYLNRHALQTVKETYDKHPECLATYGSYETPDGRYGKYNGYVAETISIRKQPWVTSHLKTFKYKLWKHISTDHLIGDGYKYFQCASDLAIMFQIVELAGYDHIQHIEEPVYVYRDHELSEHRVRAGFQKAEEYDIRNFEPVGRV